MIYGSLFSGIGGFDLGLDRAGMQCAWQVEIDDFATMVLEKHWPGVPKFRDIRNCGAHNLTPVDVVCGGFPCQGISAANPKGLGLRDERSGLWSEYARIICEIKPRWVVVENVVRLLSINNGRDFGTVLADLAANGYDAEWDCVPAYYGGSPQLRDRIFLVAYNDLSWRQGHRRGNGIRRRFWGQGKVETIGRTGIVPENVVAITKSRMGGVVNGIPRRVDADRLFGIGNAVVPQIAEWIGRRIIEIENEVQQEGVNTNTD